MNWIQQEVGIRVMAGRGGSRRLTVRGWVRPDIPGLAVTPLVLNSGATRYAVTHLPSGQKLCERDTLRAAQVAACKAQQLASAGGFSWDQEARTLGTVPAAVHAVAYLCGAGKRARTHA